MSARDKDARAQRTWLESQQELRDATEAVARANERLRLAQEALQESEDELFPEKDDQSD